MSSTLLATVQSLSVCACIGLGLAVLPGAYGGELFAWHPLFMSVGFLGFMTEGILAAYRFRPTDGAARVQAIQNHGWIQVAATVSVGCGFAAIYKNKALHNKAHFTSLHGKVGLINLLLVALAPLLGILSFRKMGLITKLPEAWQPRVKWLHRMLAVGTWALALVTMQLDLPHPAVFEGLKCRAWQATMVALGGSMLVALRTRFVGKSSLPVSLQQAAVKHS